MLNNNLADPVFVGGDARSGTTYLMALLNRHPDVWISDESNFINRIWNNYENKLVTTTDEVNHVLNLIYTERKFVDWQLNHDDLLERLSSVLPMDWTEIVREILQADRDTKSPGSAVYGIKKPTYTRNPIKLLERFPTAKFISITRDGRAVFNSKRKTKNSETGEIFEENPMEAAEIWLRKVRDFDLFSMLFPGNALEISYEKLLTSTDQVLLEVWKFLEISHIPLDELFRNPSSVVSIPGIRRNLHPNIGELPKLKRINAWKDNLDEKQIRDFEITASLLLNAKGYDLYEVKRPTFATIRYKSYLYLKFYREKIKFLLYR